MSVTLPYPTLTAGATISADELNQNFSTLANKFGNIDNSDVKSGAGVSIDKLSASYEYLNIRFTLTNMNSTDTIDVCPLYNDGKGDWTYVATQWATQDTGDPTGVFVIQWGSYTGGAASATPALTVVSTIDTVALAGVEIQSQNSDASPSVTSLASGTNRMLWARVSTIDANADSPVYISCLLKRQIKT